MPSLSTGRKILTCEDGMHKVHSLSQVFQKEFIHYLKFPALHGPSVKMQPSLFHHLGKSYCHFLMMVFGNTSNRTEQVYLMWSQVTTSHLVQKSNEEIEFSHWHNLSIKNDASDKKLILFQTELPVSIFPPQQ